VRLILKASDGNSTFEKAALLQPHEIGNDLGRFAARLLNQFSDTPGIPDRRFEIPFGQFRLLGRYRPGTDLLAPVASN
jgi:hypothetical protein